jgi:hypothetical protein
MAPPPGAAPIRRWPRRVFYYAGCFALIAAGGLIGLIGLLKVQGAEYPLNVEMRQGCLADPSLVPPGASCPHEAEAVLHYPQGRTEVIRGTPQQVERRVARATDRVVAAERWRGLGYLLVATLLVGGGIAAIGWGLVRSGPRRFRQVNQSGGDGAGSPAG